MSNKLVFDYQEFERQVEKVSAEYGSRSPFSYAYFDGMFSNELINSVNAEIDLAKFEKDVREIDGIEVKTRSCFEDNELLPNSIRKVFEVINGGRLLNIISKLTGITGLISDPYYDGGGVNIIENGGTLAVHIDGTTQHRMQVCRRINSILFLNEDWDESWNGYHEQWDFENKSLSPFDPNQKWCCVRKILPKKNRLYLFTTNDHSWHGHAGVLSVPEGVQRRSLIAYYYSSSRSKSDLKFDNPHRALFINNDITLTPSAFSDTEIVL